MASVLVSGGTGFIGKNFAECSSFGNVRSISLRNTDPAGIDFSGIDTVLHLAAIVHKSHGIRTGEYFRVNRDLTLSFARAARASGIKQFIFLSSSKVYGDERTDFPLKEDSECFPSDAYGKSKYEAEQGLLQLNDRDFIVTIIRTPAVYGKGMKANMLNLTRLVKYIPVLPLGKISNKRNYTYVKNLISFIDRAISMRTSGIIIAMDINPLSTTELAQMIADALGYKRLFFKLSPGKILRDYSNKLYGSFILDNSLTRQILSFTPPFSTREGIKETITDLYGTH